MIQYKNNEDYFLTTLILLGELVVLNLIVYVLRQFLPVENMVDIFHYRRVHAMLTLMYIVCNRYSGTEVHSRYSYGYRILRNVLLNQLLFLAGTAVLLYAVAPELFVWWLLLVQLLTQTVVITFYRKAMRMLIQYVRSHTKHPVQTVILADKTVNIEHFVMRMHLDKTMGYKVLGYFADEPNETWKGAGISYLGTPDTSIAWLENNVADVRELYCTLDPVWSDLVNQRLFPLCDKYMFQVKVIPGFLPYEHTSMTIHMEGDYPVFDMRNNPMQKVGNRFLKRMFDILVSGVFLITVFPFVYLIFGALIKLSSPGPVFFRQKRSGLDGKVFEMYKFRSMKVNSESDTKQATRDDDRKTRIGDFMRRTSIDELPQFINVFIGDMSIIGPRPHMVAHTEQYSELISHYMVRHMVKPGITGYAQVTGYRGETDELWKMQGRVEADVWYLEHWSLMLDMWIFFRTIFRFKDVQAY